MRLGTTIESSEDVSGPRPGLRQLVLHLNVWPERLQHMVLASVESDGVALQ